MKFDARLLGAKRIRRRRRFIPVPPYGGDLRNVGRLGILLDLPIKKKGEKIHH